MATTVRYLLPVLFLVGVSAAHAAGEDDTAARAKAIAPFVDTQTIAVGHLNLARIEVDPLLDKLVELAPEFAGDGPEDRSSIRRVHAAFLKAGARDAYVVVSLADIPARPPFVIIPRADEVDTKALVANLPPAGPDEVVERFEGALFLGNRHTLERLKAMTPTTRPELVDAFRAAGDTPIQVLLVPTDDDRRVIEELMPTLPSEIGGGPSTVLTQGMRWLALGVDPPPRISLQMLIQSESREAAAALRVKWLEMPSILSQLDTRPGALQDIDAALALLVPEVDGDQLVLSMQEPDRSVRALLDAVTPLVVRARNKAVYSQSMNHLKQLGLAMHNFHDIHKRLPAIGTFDAAGKPLLSWRVHVLPFVDQQKLYDQFRLDEPWDSDHNRKLIERMPEVFRCPASRHRQKSGLATYREVIGAHTVFPGREGIEFKQITDGTSNTIMLVEVDDDHAVVWTRPEGLPFNAQNPAEGLGGHFDGGFQAVICDGSANFLELPHDPERLRLLLTRDDGKPIPR